MAMMKGHDQGNLHIRGLLTVSENESMSVTVGSMAAESQA